MKKIIILGLILGGIGFFANVKAVELPAGFTPPVNPNEKLTDDSKNTPPENSQNPVAFKQINLVLSDLKLDNIEYSSGDTVKGSFKLKNDSNMYSSGFYYQVALHKPDTSKENVIFFNQLTAIDSIQSEIINVAPQEEKSLSFSYKIPKFCLAGSGYSIRVTIMNARGFELASGFQILVIKNPSGDERFVYLDQTNSQVFTGAKPYRLQDGGVFEYDKEYNPAMEKDKPNKNITLKNEVQARVAYSVKSNPKEKPVAKVFFYKHGNYLNLLESKDYEIPSLENSGTFDLKLPLFQNPGAYEAVVQLFVGEEKISNPLIIRYTTQGDSGLVYDFLVEKNGGNNFTLNMLWSGPADLNVRKDPNGFGAQILFEAKEEKSQKTCFEKTIEIDPKQGALTQLPFVMGDCSEPYQFNAKLQKDGKTLDQQQIAEPKKEETKKSEDRYSIKNIIFIGFGILTIILLAVVFLKKRSNKFVPMILLALAASLGFFFLSAKETKAAHHGTYDFHTSSGGPYHFMYYNPIWGGYYTQPACPSGYTWGGYSDWVSNYLCCPTDATNLIGEWEQHCYGGWENSYDAGPPVQATPGYWTSYIAGYYPAYDYYINGTSFNQGQTLSFYEAIHAYPNCGNGGGPGPGASYFYLYSQTTGALVWQSSYGFNEYSGGAGISVPLNFAPGGYTFVIYGWKTFYGGEDDPMYNGSISIVGSINIINPNATLSVGYPGGNGLIYDGVGIYCGGGWGYCSTSIPFNNWRTLYATSLNGATFSSWTGDCAGAGSNPTCSLFMNTSKNVSAVFNCSCDSNEDSNRCVGKYTNSCGASCTGSKTPDCSNASNVCKGTSFNSANNCGSCVGTMEALNGQCGAAANSTFYKKPDADLCSVGTASQPNSSDNWWTWNCSGVCGGSSTKCVAQRDKNMKEVQP